jgi:iron complex outermembrane receptor protein
MRIKSTLLLLAMTGASFVAFSQEPESNSVKASSENGASQSELNNITDNSVDNSGDETEKVVVYGQKRETIHALRLLAPLEQTPVSVNIISKELLEQQQAISLEDALRNVSGVSKYGSYGLSDNINIRGFDIGLSGGPENYRINGVMLRTPYSDYIEEVQILKGPASILYGDVEPGGIVNYVTKKPLGYEHRKFELKVGQYNLYRPSVDIGGALNESVDYRINTVFESSDSYRDEVSNEQLMFAPSFSWEISEDTTLLVEAIFMRNEATIDWGMPLGLPLERAEQLNPRNFYGYPDGTSEGKNNTLSTTFNHHFSDTWSLRNVLAFSNQERLLHDVYPVYNASEDIVEYSWGDYRELSETSTLSNFLDLNGEFQTGAIKHRFTASLDVSRITRPVAYNFVWPIVGSTSLVSPSWQNVALSSTPTLNKDEMPFTRRIGVNLQDLMSFYNDRLHILIGARYSKFTSGTDYSGNAQKAVDYSDTEESEVTPRLGFTYEILDGSFIYASYSESFSSVAPSPGRGLTDPQPLIGDQVEFGWKQSLFDERLGVTVSYFDLNRKNVLQFETISTDGSFSDPSNFRANQTGEHSSSGLEVDVNGKLADNWQVFASYSHINSEVVRELVQSGNSEPVNYAGLELPNNPRNKFSLWSQYSFEQRIPGLSLAIGIFYQGDMYGDRLNTSDNTIDGFTRVDAMVGYQYDDNMNLRLNIQNLNDVETFQRSLFGSYVPQMQRRVVASVSMDF